MPGIWNVNNGYSANTKKISSKLTFEVGERFSGRVVSKGDGKEVTVKLTDGWQFTAELEGNIDLDNQKLAKFQVSGFESGKLKLKLAQGNIDEDDTEDEDFREIVEKEGFSKDDVSLLKDMVKHGISLSRDNINQVKSLIQFNEKMSTNPKEIDAFIQTYLQSKGLSSDSADGRSIKDTLTKFFNEFKNMTSDDILTFVENNLDFSEESINSFNKLFKGNSSIEEILIKISDSLNSLEFSEDTINENKINQNIINNKLLGEESEPTRNALDTTALASKIYNENDVAAKKINVLDVLKTLAGSDDSQLDLVQKNASKETDTVSLPQSLVEKLNNKEIVKLITDAIGDNPINNNGTKTQAEKLIESANKLKLESLLSNIEGKDIKFTDNEFKAFNNLLNSKTNGNVSSNGSISSYENSSASIKSKEISTNSNKEELVKFNNEEILLKSNLGGKDGIKAEMKEKIDSIGDIVKNILSKTDGEENGYDKIVNLIKENINDIKVYNSISDQYYYLNIPITANSEQYPCKLMIKDNRKDGKRIDTTNAKMIVTVKTAKLGEIDGYLTIKENKMDVDLKCDSEFEYIIKNNKSKLKEGLSTLGLFVNVNVSIKDKPVDLVNCRNFFNDLTISSIDIKV